ncbi:MAG: hypothetical protein R3A52_01490 [Polyangiales bacterium]
MQRAGASGWIALRVACAVSLASCVEPRTELVARVDSELAWGEGQRVQSVAVEVRRGGPTGALRSQRVSALGVAAGRQRLPMFVGVRESAGDTDTPVWIEALGCAAPNGCDRDTAVVAQRALVRFQEGATLEVPLLFASACEGVRCAATERCEVTTGVCRPASEAPVTSFSGADAGGRDDVFATDHTDASSPDDATAVDDVVDAPDVVDAVESRDAGAMDNGPDAGVADTGPTDSGPADAGAADADPLDSGPIDTGVRDTGPMDTGPVDTGPSPDTGSGPGVNCPSSPPRFCPGSNACCIMLGPVAVSCGCDVPIYGCLPDTCS